VLIPSNDSLANWVAAAAARGGEARPLVVDMVLQRENGGTAAAVGVGVQSSSCVAAARDVAADALRPRAVPSTTPCWRRWGWLAGRPRPLSTQAGSAHSSSSHALASGGAVPPRRSSAGFLVCASHRIASRVSVCVYLRARAKASRPLNLRRPRGAPCAPRRSLEGGGRGIIGGAAVTMTPAGACLPPARPPVLILVPLIRTA
jgi:hypothetical protein